MLKNKNEKVKENIVEIEEEKKEMTCSPTCVFFPDVNCQEWVYDKNDPNIKRRAVKKDYVCCYDGHVIKSWYGECPKKKDGFGEEKNN